MQKRYGAQGLQVVGINMDDAGDLKDVARFAAENGVNYPILIGQEAVAQQYGGIDSLPTTFYLDRKGEVVERFIGQPNGQDEVEKSIRLALGLQ
jgi:peroxiredoxin